MIMLISGSLVSRARCKLLSTLECHYQLLKVLVVMFSCL